MLEIDKYLNLLKKTYERFLKIKGHPRQIALGFALGVFISMSPTFGFQMIIAVFFASILKWSKVSAAVGVWVSNPFTVPVIYSMTYFVGAKFMGLKNTIQFPDELSVASFFNILEKTPNIFAAMTIGGIILGVPLAMASYFISYEAVNDYRKSVKPALINQKNKLAKKRKQRKHKRALRRAGKRFKRRN